MVRILNYGSLNLDYVYAVEHAATPGETVSALGRKVFCGGKGLNQSIAASRAGASVFHAGKLGNGGEMLRELLTENGVDVSCLAQTDSENGHAVIQVDTTGQNCILLYPGSNREITREEIDAALAGFSAGDFLLLQNEINEIPYLLEQAKRKGMFTVLNPSPITPELFGFPLQAVDLLVLNEVEGEALTGKRAPEDILHALREKLPNCRILLSLGKNGAVYCDGETVLRHGIYRVDVKDTTGAGDTLTGYFVACLARGESPETALRLASVAASVSVSREGAAASVPTLAEVLAAKLPYLVTES